jgi:hypothetical protein
VVYGRRAIEAPELDATRPVVAMPAVEDAPALGKSVGVIVRVARERIVAGKPNRDRVG